MKTKLIYITGFLFLLSAKVFTQVQLDQTPLSPQMEAFKQHGDINVNLATGVPNISIPLLEINHHGYKLPLSLDYYPTPLKPGGGITLLPKGLQDYDDRTNLAIYLK